MANFSADKIPCARCGAMILPITAKERNGLCVPCELGARENIDATFRQRKAERENPDPALALWSSVVAVVYNSTSGFAELSWPKKVWFAVGMLDKEVCNGGIEHTETEGPIT